MRKTGKVAKMPCMCGKTSSFIRILAQFNCCRPCDSRGNCRLSSTRFIRKTNCLFISGLLNRFGLGVDFNVFHDPAELVGNLKGYADVATLIYLDMVYKLN